MRFFMNETGTGPQKWKEVLPQKDRPAAVMFAALATTLGSELQSIVIDDKLFACIFHDDGMFVATSADIDQAWMDANDSMFVFGEA